MENWRPVKGYEGYYEVSDLGRVKALARTVSYLSKFGKPCTKELSEHIMAPQRSSNGYLQVGLSKGKIVRICRIHRLVAEAFIDNSEGLPEVNHIDEDKTNNRVDNLEWCTRQYNNSYGTKRPIGERNGMAKLTSDDVKEIRKRRARGEMLKTIAEDFGISVNHVCNLAKGRKWSHEVSTCG